MSWQVIAQGGATRLISNLHGGRLMSKFEARQLRHFIEQQDQTSRYILLLHYFENLTDKEISIVLDLSENFVSRRLIKLQQQAQQVIMLCQPANTSTITSSNLSAIA